ncbi:MAG: class I SAM-dependent methyltransferase [Clostridia bacterium]|nr:class I SAM-dependent methyltransferase [Clostridia bacterium]
MSGLEWTFDTVAPIYEKMRPGYPDELYRTLFEYAPINADSNVAEIGIGGGQATLPLLETGCRLTAIEYGEQFSRLVRDKFSSYVNFSVITGRFEETELEENSFDLVFSASAFHWIPEKEGYERVYSMLKNGGVFARFANHPYRDKGNPELSREIDKAYRDFYNRFYNKESKAPSEYTEAQARERAEIAEKYGFREVKYALFYRKRTFSATEYTALLGTYSDHIAIEEPIRAAFFARIEEAIDRHGGFITLYDTIDLELARK